VDIVSASPPEVREFESRLALLLFKPSRISAHMSNDTETRQMWHFVLCQEHDAIKDDVGCTGTPCETQDLRVFLRVYVFEG
jgi:hypothetical protein